MISLIKTMFIALSLLSLFHIEIRAMEIISQNKGKEKHGGAAGNVIFQEESKNIIALASTQIAKLIPYAKEKKRELSSLHDAFLGSKESKKGLGYQRYLIAQKTESNNAE